MALRQLKITNSFTQRDSDQMNKYLCEIGKIPLLDMEEETELAHRIQSGDETAKKKLVESNLRFVVSVAKMYLKPSLDILDLINEGNMGLIRAAELYDPTRGFKFISYAVWWIRSYIMDFCEKNSSLIPIPGNAVAIKREIIRFERDFFQKNEYYPTNQQIAEGVGCDIIKVEEIKTAYKIDSIDVPTNETNEETIANTLKDEDAEAYDIVDKKDLQFDMARAIEETLSDREKEVIKMSFGIDYPEMTRSVIAERLGVCPERVRQIIYKALKKLKKGSSGKLLQKYRQ